MRARGFTLIEVMVIVIIVGILAMIGIPYYGKVVEKNRAAEAKTSLMTIRTYWGNYILEHKDRPSSLNDILDEASEDIIPGSCTRNSHYRYRLAYPLAVATRCTGGAGKPPSGRTSYEVTIDLENGSWSGTEGYY